MAKEKIRVRLRGFDVELIDQARRAIVQTGTEGGAKRLRAHPRSRLNQ
jgi:small subunit ribosomal protein S10